MSKTYKMWGRCQNCSATRTISVPFRKPCEPFLQGEKCSYCGGQGFTPAGPVAFTPEEKPEPAGMTFGEAVEAMQLGKKVRRLAWRKDLLLERGRADENEILSSGVTTGGTPYSEIWQTVKIEDCVATDWQVVE